MIVVAEKKKVVLPGTSVNSKRDVCTEKEKETFSCIQKKNDPHNPDAKVICCKQREGGS